MSDPVASLTIRDLDRATAEAILARNHVGRLAFNLERQVDIEPIGYVYAGGVINFRTSPGTKLEALRHQYAAAFEVDEIVGPFSWQSVVVHGTVYRVTPEGSAHDRKAYAEAREALERAYPGALGPADPAGFRTVILQLHIGTITGRAAGSAP